MTTKIDLPALNAPLTRSSVSAWLNGCSDTFETLTLLNPSMSSSLSARMKITLAGLKMQEPTASAWWNEHRDELKDLASWDAFVERVRDRFIPAGWKLDALERFYTVSQGSSDFRTFVASLQVARNDLAGAGTNYTISDSIMKNHIFFRSNRHLRLRVRANPAFKYENLKVDGLIGLMQITYDSLVAEGVLRSDRSLTQQLPATTPGTKPAARLPPPDLTPAERDRLKAVGGCYQCRLDPSSPGWTPHSSRNCPNNPSRNVLPSKPPASTIPPVITACVFEATDSRADVDPQAVGAVAFGDDEPLESCVLEYDPNDPDGSDFEWD